MDEKLKQTIETLGTELAETEDKAAKIESELANPFLKPDLRVKYKKAAAYYGQLIKKLKNQIRGLKLLGHMSAEELEKLKQSRLSGQK